MTAVGHPEIVPPKKLDLFVFLFAVTLFLSASLTFTVQPMIGKILLPMVGGSPSGWLVTMAYFQIALLAGYFIAHLMARSAETLEPLRASGWIDLPAPHGPVWTDDFSDALSSLYVLQPKELDHHAQTH